MVVFVGCQSQEKKFIEDISNNIWIVNSVQIGDTVIKKFRSNYLLISEDKTCTTPMKIEDVNFNHHGNWFIVSLKEDYPKIEFFDCDYSEYDGIYTVVYREYEKIFTLNLLSEDVKIYCTRGRLITDDPYRAK